MKTWTDLYQTFARLAALVTNAEANAALEEFSQRVVDTVTQRSFQMVNIEFAFFSPFFVLVFLCFVFSFHRPCIHHEQT
jgi:hypothetical protein